MLIYQDDMDGVEAKTHTLTNAMQCTMKKKKNDERNKVPVVSREDFLLVAYHVTWIRSLNT